MTGVLCFFALAGLRVKVGLEYGVDVVDFHAVEIERREGLGKAEVGLPVVAVGCRGDVTGILIAFLHVEANRHGCGGLVVPR